MEILIGLGLAIALLFTLAPSTPRTSLPPR
jgi:hypothetical protein